MHEKKKKLILSEDCMIQHAMEVLNEVPLGIVMLVDSNDRLIGVATDGDIRRALVKGASINSPLREIMCKNPVVINEGYNKNQALRMFSERIKQIPIINKDKRVVDLLLYSEFCNISTNKKNIIVRAKAPLRISFAGGGTDVNPYIEEKGGVVLSATINKYCFGSLKKRSDEKIVIHSRDYGQTVEIENLQSIKYDGNLDLFKAVIKIMKPEYGMNLYFESNTPPGSGLGGSATIASVTVGLMDHMREDKLDDYQLAEIAFQAERVELGIAGGWQDQYAAVFGGFNYMEFKEDNVIVHPLKIKDDILNELECSLLLCFTGQTRDSGIIVERQTDAYVVRDKRIVKALDQTKEISLKIKNALLRGDIVKFGQLLHKAWLLKKKFDNTISNSFIDNLYNTGIKAGAIGGKLLGAGSGGYILFYCPHYVREDVAMALESIGGKILDFNFDFRGLQTWIVQDSSEF